MSKTLAVGDRYRDRFEIEYDWNGEKLVVLKSQIFGCHEFKKRASRYLEALSLGESWSFSSDHVGQMLKEIDLKLKDNWNPPYSDTEICHCRVVATETVLQAIRSGCSSHQKISAVTGASTACGSCQTDVVALLDYFKSHQESD